jgi:hypothetical protein
MSLGIGGISASPLGTPVIDYSLIEEIVVTGSHVTSIEFTGLNLIGDGAYILHYNLTNPTGSTSYLRLYFNSDTTDANYYGQNFDANGAVISGARGNVPTIDNLTAGTSSMNRIIFSQIAGEEPRAMTQLNRLAPAGLKTGMDCVAWVTTNNVTIITLTASVASAIGIGSKFLLYKVKA